MVFVSTRPMRPLFAAAALALTFGACWSAEVTVTGVAPAGLAGSPVADATLAGVRGGFVDASGAVLTIDVARSVQINGRTVAAAKLQLGNSGGLALVQVGSGNTFDAGKPVAATVIQNTLDHQKIQFMTVIDVTANSRQLVKGLDLQSSLAGALAASLRR